MNTFRNVAVELIEERKKDMSAIRYRDALSLLLEASENPDEESRQFQPLSETELLSNIRVLLIAGHETTGMFQKK